MFLFGAIRPRQHNNWLWLKWEVIRTFALLRAFLHTTPIQSHQLALSLFQKVFGKKKKCGVGGDSQREGNQSIVGAVRVI